MASILSDDILNCLLCSICKKYLSCGPTKVHRNGGISCGRCSNNEVTSPNSLYEEVARYSLFPCVNRYEGCNKLLQYQDVAQHEKLCKGTLFPCPLCPSQQQFSLLFLIDHYKTLHKKYFLKEPKFFIDSNKMCQHVILYCDNSSNCIFTIEVGCTQDRLFLKVSLLGNDNDMPVRFLLNNEIISSYLEEIVSQQIAEISSEQNKLILCEFLYEVSEKTVPVVALDLDSFKEPAKEERAYYTLPKIYLDSKFFPETGKYKLSSCKTKLINERNSNFGIKLKCDSCDMYFWNIFKWTKDVAIRLEDCTYIYEYSLYSRKFKDLDDLICAMCYQSLYSYMYYSKEQLCTPTTKAPIFKLMFYCRFGCGFFCFVWDLSEHEKKCRFNLENESEEYVKKCFGENSYNANDMFIIGNVVKPFNMKSLEQVIYLITENGLKCKIYCTVRDYSNFTARVEHDYDEGRYIVTLSSKITLNTSVSPGPELRYVKDPKQLSLSVLIDTNIITPHLIVIIKKMSPKNNVQL